MKKILVGVVSFLSGVGIGAIVAGKIANKVIYEKHSLVEKFTSLFLMMERWVKVKQEEKSLVEYFQSNNILNIAVYGMGVVGERIVDELRGSVVTIDYGIDKNTNVNFPGLTIYDPSAELPKTDAIIVTAISYFDDIEEMLSLKVECPIISLEDILYDLV